MQQHIVFGAGLIGGFLGGVLTSLNLPTQLVCRPKIQQKLKNGLILTDYLGNKRIVEKITFLDKVSSFTSVCDVLWITVKCTAVEAVSREIKPLVSSDTIILCCQNGLGSAQIVQQYFPDNTVLRVMVAFNVSESEAGHLHRGSEGTLTIENDTKQSGVIAALVNQMNTPILPVSLTSDMNALLWAKLQLNLGNSVNALADIPVRAMLEQRPYRLVIAALMKELLTVTKALNIDLPKVTALKGSYLPYILSLPNFLYKMIFMRVLAIDPTVRSSMWWDLSQGKPTEIDFLNGAVVEAAKKLNVSYTANQNIIKLIKDIENTPLKQRKGGIDSKTLLRQIKSK